VYPSVKGSSAAGGYLDVHNTKELIFEFNCLGIEQKTNITLQINLLLHTPIKLFIEKECSKGIFLQNL
jgi:hypothetical protein